MSYRLLFRTSGRAVSAWAAVAVCARMPVAMAPLAVVLLVRERPGGYSLGAVLAAVYVVGEIIGAPLLGTRLRAERARPQLAAGLAVGACGFGALGLAHAVHPALLGVFAFVAGAAPGAAPGALRALLTRVTPDRAVPQAMSFESILTFGVWAVAPAATAGLALSVAPWVPLLLAGGLMAVSVPGLWLLPVGWVADGGKDQERASVRVLLRAWPAYVTGAASLSLLAMAELILPALLEQRGFGVGLAGPLLAGFSIGSAVGAFVYGLRAWPGRLPTQSLVLVLGVSGCVAGVALVPWAGAIAAGLVVAGVLQAGAMLTRNLTLREMLPPGALAAGYSVMYAAVGAGYAGSGSLAGAMLRVVPPSGAVLVGVGVTVVLGVAGFWGERGRSRVRGSGGSGGGRVCGVRLSRGRGPAVLLRAPRRSR
ncbi:MFS transporter [Streptomyces sp. VRA16 Mangrove soil]|uniref:MFS transporter n=1 Tax=Streptomyces sp. VRA16 Mangrove soil TaxID=2817434 RepID=UPI001A9FABA1|nr:MFS transporter [Streptomyces sp. VRA16 Mangrove soil]MBO1337665.1 MFS transporter [Streptomyces sp. VRA16 Mangrove soil]